MVKVLKQTVALRNLENKIVHLMVNECSNQSKDRLSQQQIQQIFHAIKPILLPRCHSLSEQKLFFETFI